MKKPEYTNLLKQGKVEWNQWRDENQNVKLNFSDLILDGMNLEGYHLDNSNFNQTSLRGCNLNNAWLAWCNFFHCDLSESTITNPEVDDLPFNDKRLMGVNIRWTTFACCKLDNVNFRHAVLEGARFHDCSLNGANLSESLINGLSAWGNTYDSSTLQDNLYITEMDKPILTVDNFEIAQFLFLISNNKNIRSAIDSLATKIVLILGGFSKEDKPYLDTIKSELKTSDYIPVMYDFDKPDSRNHTETVSAIAHLSSFIIGDLTNQRSIPHELASIIPHLRSVPVIPIVRCNFKPFGMFDDYKSFLHVGEVINYDPTEPIFNIVQKIFHERDQIKLKMKVN
ncbi:MAG: pentapeptide repeat-containing protein [Sphingobacteriales bacterium]|nr:MAG: pentapeptide repeat-containing protein [Sphingobacteriales bacterium]